jgi:hypothetical protein
MEAKSTREIANAVAFHHNPDSTQSILAGILNLAEENALDNRYSRENLWCGMRRATAARFTGIQGFSRTSKPSLLAIAS